MKVERKPKKDRVTQVVSFRVKDSEYREFKKRGKGNANKFARRAALREIGVKDEKQ